MQVEMNHAFVSNLGNRKIQTLQHEVFGGINHGFHLTFNPCCLPHTHDPLIESEYGEFQTNLNITQP